jgi:hypothetical protein
MTFDIHLPEWPADTSKCIFLGRAVAQLEQVAAGRDIASLVIDAIDRGEFALRARLVGVTDNHFGHVDKAARTPEGWAVCLRDFVIEEVDRRPWVSVRHRRRMPQPHWLFVTRDSFGLLLERVSKPNVAPIGRRPGGRSGRR